MWGDVGEIWGGIGERSEMVAMCVSALGGIQVTGDG